MTTAVENATARFMQLCSISSIVGTASESVEDNDEAQEAVNDGPDFPFEANFENWKLRQKAEK